MASLFRAGLFLPQVLPIAVTGIVWGWLLAPTGAVNSALHDVGLDSLAKNWLGDPNWALAQRDGRSWSGSSSAIRS